MAIHKPEGGWKTGRVTTHPGEILQEEFLTPMGISQNTLAQDLRIPQQRVNEIVRGERSVTPDTALRLAAYFGTSPELWLNLQQSHDLSKVVMERGESIAQEVRVRQPEVKEGSGPVRAAAAR